MRFKPVAILVFVFAILLVSSYSTFAYIGINYWIEHDENNQPTNNVWVKVNLTANEPLSFYVYYNPEANDDTTITNGLVAYYPFNGNANDESGNGNDGTVYGATLTTDRFGRSNKAYSFDGTDDYISLPTSAIVSGSNPRTVCAWVKTTAVDKIIYFSGAESTANAFGLSLGKYGEFKVFTWGGDSYDLTTSIKVNDNKWHFVCGQYDGSNIRAFVDGKLVGSKAVSINTLTDAHYIGRRVNDVGFFNGAVDEVRIYSRALSDEEVKQLYEETSLKFSDGDAVFEFFDDFEGSSLDTSKWVISSGTASVSNGHLVVGGDGNANRLYTVSSWTQARYITRFYVSPNDGDFEIGPNNMKKDGAWTVFVIYTLSSPVYRFYDENSLLEDVSRNVVATTEKSATFNYISGIKQEIIYDSKTITKSYSGITEDLYFNIYAFGTNTLYVDYVAVAKYSSTEPSVSYGSEESGSWTIDGHTYTKRRKVTITSTTDLEEYQVALDYSQFGDDKLYISTINVEFSVSLTQEPTNQTELALDPENNITAINVTFRPHFLGTDSNLTYWNITEDGVVIAEGNSSEDLHEIVRTYTTIANHTVCFNAIGVDVLGNPVHDSDCKNFTIDQYPQNLSMDYTPHLPYEDENILFFGDAQDNNNNLKFNWVLYEKQGGGRPVAYWIDPETKYMWVRIPNIPANSSVVIEINKSDDGALPDGNAVFDIFSDMSNASIWSLKRCTINETTKEMTCTQRNNDYSVLWYKEIPSMYNISVVGSWLTTDNDGGEAGLDIGLDAVIGGGNDIRQFGKFYGIYPESANYYKIFRHVDKTSTEIYSQSFTLPANSRRQFDIRIYKVNNQTQFLYYDDGSLVSNWTDTSNPPLEDDGGFLAIREWEGKLYWIGLRKYYGVEPQIQVENKTTYYEVKIDNPYGKDLLGYVVPVPANELGINAPNETFKVIKVKIIRNTAIKTLNAELLTDNGNGYDICLEVKDEYNLTKTKCSTFYVFQRHKVIARTLGTEFFSSIITDPRLRVIYAKWITNYGTYENYWNNISVELENQTMLKGNITYTFYFDKLNENRTYSSNIPYVDFIYTVHEGFFPLVANETMNATWNFSNAVKCNYKVFNQTYEWVGVGDANYSLNWTWNEGREVNMTVSCVDTWGDEATFTETNSINVFKIEPRDEETDVYNTSLWEDIQTSNKTLFRFIAVDQEFNTSYIWESINKTVWLVLNPNKHWIFRFEEHFSDQVIINSYDLKWAPSTLKVCVSPDLPNIYQTAFSSIPIEGKAFAITRAETGCIRTINPTNYIKDGYGFNFYTQAGQYAIWLLEEGKTWNEKTLLGNFYGDVQTVVDLEKLLLLVQEAEKVIFGPYELLKIEKIVQNNENATVFKWYSNQDVKEFILNVTNDKKETIFYQKVEDSNKITIIMLWRTAHINSSNQIIYVNYKAVYSDGTYLERTIRTTPTGREIKYLWWQALFIMILPIAILFMRTFNLQNLLIFASVEVALAILILPFAEFHVVTQTIGILSVIALIIGLLILKKVI